MADYIRKYKTPEELLKVIATRVEYIHALDLRIADIYLHPNCVEVIGKDPNLDPIRQMAVLRALPGIVGLVWGMRLFKSTVVPEEHMAFIIDGIDGKLVGREACVAL